MLVVVQPGVSGHCSNHPGKEASFKSIVFGPLTSLRAYGSGASGQQGGIDSRVNP